jgi:hypothetical protein
MKAIDAELAALRAVCATLDELPDDETRNRVLAAVLCLYDNECAGAVLRAWKRRVA